MVDALDLESSEKFHESSSLSTRIRRVPLGTDPPTKENNPQIPVEQDRKEERNLPTPFLLPFCCPLSRVPLSIGSERKEDARQTREKILKENS